MCENFVIHTHSHIWTHMCMLGDIKWNCTLWQAKREAEEGGKKEVKSATKTEREMSYFSTLPAGDHGNAMPGHWYSCCSHSSLLLRIIIIISDGHRSRACACARRCPPATRLCPFHFIIVITLCHNLFCPPTFLMCTWYEERRHYYYAISVPKTGQFPWHGPAIFLLFSVICAANCFHGFRQVFNYWQIRRPWQQQKQLKLIN